MSYSTRISINELADVMFELSIFTAKDLTRRLTIRGHHCTLNSIRCRIAQLANRVDPETNLSGITKTKLNGKSAFSVSAKQYKRLCDSHNFIKASKKDTTKFITDNNGNVVKGSPWSTKTRLSGKPGTTVVIIN